MVSGRLQLMKLKCIAQATKEFTAKPIMEKPMH